MAEGLIMTTGELLAFANALGLHPTEAEFENFCGGALRDAVLAFADSLGMTEGEALEDLREAFRVENEDSRLRQPTLSTSNTAEGFESAPTTSAKSHAAYRHWPRFAHLRAIGNTRTVDGSSS